jgi:mercuric ion transport protein
MKTQIALSVITALSASMCCITPILALAAGTGSVVSSFHWIEPLRPYLISASVLMIGFAWFQSFKSKKDEDCNCEIPKKKSFIQSRTFLGVVTIVSFLLITFPSYSKLIFDDSTNQISQDQNKNKKIELAVSGMTCMSCEMHIEGEVKKLPGVASVKASYEKGSAVVEYNDTKIDKEKIIATINNTGYTVSGKGLSTMLAGKENCTASSCQIPTGELPNEVSKNLIVLKDMNQLKSEFNKQPENTRFIAILSSTCKWCLQGAESVQKAIVEKMADKNISVIIVWTNMLNSDEENTAYRAASFFKQKDITQFFDQENKFGDIAAKAINPKGEQAWDIYMYFDKDSRWDKTLPRPFEYVHQLGPSTTWADQTKYFCGSNLTKRLLDVTNTL